MASQLSSSSNDEGFADNLMIYNWAVSKKHNYDQVYPSDDMELIQLLVCEAISQVQNKTIEDSVTFMDH